MPTVKQIATMTGVTLVTAGIGYCFYFDYKRRHDASFRRRLQRDQKQAAKTAKASSAENSANALGMLKSAVEAINAEPLPEGVEGRESFFMEQVGMGEMLAQRLPQGAVPAAIAFFKAYKVYPSPQELIMIYQRTMPQEVFMLVMEMIKIDVNATLKAGPSSTRLATGPIIEEIPLSERSQPTSSAKPSSSGKSEMSPTQSTAPSEQGSNTGQSFVIVDGDSEASRATPVSLTESLTEGTEEIEDEKTERDAELSVKAESPAAVAAEVAASAEEVPEVIPEP